MHQVPGPAA